MADEKKGAADKAPATEANAPDAANEALQQGAGLRVLAQFMRDFSFENPRAPDSLRGEKAPKIDMDVELAARNRTDGLFEVDLKLTVSALRETEVVFHVEALYGGLFQIEGIPEAEMEAVLLIECPRYLFPFVRRIVADITAEGGFPPFRIDPIDFAGIYMARRAEGAVGKTVTPIEKA